ncbi:MAG TPA: WG repeat-containing protein [Cytophagaceae bacterium]|nr:WG repeat-containing protein [Cytophagaceae bacterium]
MIVLFLVSLTGRGQGEYTIVQKEGNYGLTTSKGKTVLPAEYLDIQNPSGNIYAIKNKKGLWGFFSGETKLTEFRFDNFRFTNNNQIMTQEASRWGVLNEKGQTVLPFKYKYLNHISGNKFKAGRFNQWQVRTFQNEVLAVYEYDSIVYMGANLYKFCLAGKYGLIDQNDKIITTEYQNIFESTLSNKYPKKEFAKARPIIPKGNFRVPMEERFDTVYHFSEGFAKFLSNRKYGFVDSLGNIRLVPQYNNARHFSEGMVAVMLIGKWGFMDTNERLIIQPYYDEVSDFKNGITLARKGLSYYFINKEGKFLYNEPFDKVTPTFSGNYLLERKNKFGMADAYGREMISTKYEAINELGNSYIFAQEHGLWGVLNEKGNIVIPFNYSAIQYDPEHNRLITMEPGGETVINYK